MTSRRDIEIAFDAAIESVQRATAAGLATVDGLSVREQLGQLEFRLRTERGKALERGRVDRAWVQKTVRWVVEWMPESDLTVIAALGRIARIRSDGVS